MRTAARRLEKSLLAEVRYSRVYETLPAHGLDQPPYLNACCVGWTSTEPESLLDSLKQLELRGGGGRPAAPPPTTPTNTTESNKKNTAV
ncbi:MAG: 2-amino-4-hydroxy-6-hydroxymethyldihydropteridine diphosphokinase [Gemmatimonadales bacterium]|nr:2-amino-4-hydroxy-6-hydroxymethyldihydropteridine diphosphokinase [Gemmatimonadales bacterium]